MKLGFDELVDDIYPASYSDIIQHLSRGGLTTFIMAVVGADLCIVLAKRNCTLEMERAACDIRG